MKQLLLLNPEKATEEEVTMYPVRETARAVVLDDDGKVALLCVSKKNYYKLPGGGLEMHEDPRVALRRECLEEIGCAIEIINEIGCVVEYRKIFNLKQISYCYLAKIKGVKGVSSLEQGEIDDGFEGIWLFYEDALRALKESKATDFEGSAYIVPRDTALLEEAKKYLTNLA